MIGFCLCAVIARAQEGGDAAEVPPLPEVLDWDSLQAEDSRLEVWRLESSVADPDALERVLGVLAERDEAIRASLARAETEIAALTADAPSARRADLERQRTAWKTLAVKSVATRADCDTRAPGDERLAWARLADDLATGMEPRERVLARYTLAELLNELGNANAGLDLVLASLDELPASEPRRAGLSILAADTERRLGLHSDAMERVQRVLDELAELGPDLIGRGPEQLDLELGCFSVLGSCQLELGLVDRTSLCVKEMASRIEALRALRVPPAASLRQAILRTANLLQALERHAEVEALVERWLADDLVCGASPATRWTFELVRAHARLELEHQTDAGEPTARAEFEALARAPYGSETNRFALELGLAEVAYADGDLDEATLWLDRAEARLEEWGLAEELGEATNPSVHLATLRVRTLLASDASHQELAAERDRLAEEIERRLSVFEAFPPRAAGLGFLYPAARRSWFAAHTEASIALDGEEEGVRRALELVVAAQRVGTLARSIGVQAASLEEIRETLVPSDGGVLVFLPAPTRGHVFALDRVRFVHAELPAEAELRALLEELGRSFDELLHAPADPPGEMLASAREAALRSSDVLLPPEIAARVKGWEALTIVGADLLGETPLEFLVLGEEPLALSHAVAFLPSLPLGMALSAREALREQSDGECLLVAVPGSFDASLGLSALPFDEPTLRSLLEPYGDPDRWKSNRGLWFDARASGRALILEADLGSATMAQFLVHGTSDPSRERPALLCLTAEGIDRGTFSCEDVEALTNDPAGPPAAPAFVLLTACGSALGPWRPGDDAASHMGGAWLRAGARAVALASTDLRAAEALELSRAMHAELARGASPARALQRARRSLAAGGRPEALHAAGLVRILGLGHDPLFEPRGPIPSADETDGEAGSRLPFAVLLAAGLVLAGAVAAVVARSHKFKSNRLPRDL